MFTKSDVDALRSNRSTGKRADLATRLGGTIDQHDLSPEQVLQVQDIIGILAKDIEVEVRAALSRALRRSDRLPHAVAWKLANDVDVVSVPVLTSSLIFTNEDLVDIARRGSPTAQNAIAGRPHIAEIVSAALVTHGDETVVSTLMRNITSQISETSLNEALDRFPESNAVKNGMAYRGTLPVAVAERLVTMVSDELQHYMVAHHNLPRTLAAELSQRSREYAVLRISQGLDQAHQDSLVAQVDARGRLTPTLLLRALCTGHTAFFETGMARLACVPVANVRTLVQDPGARGFAALYKTSGLPPNLLTAFRAVIDVTGSEETDAARDAQRLRTLVIDRFRSLVQKDNDANVQEALACIREVTSVV